MRSPDTEQAHLQTLFAAALDLVGIEKQDPRKTRGHRPAPLTLNDLDARLEMSPALLVSPHVGAVDRALLMVAAPKGISGPMTATETHDQESQQKALVDQKALEVDNSRAPTPTSDFDEPPPSANNRSRTATNGSTLAESSVNTPDDSPNPPTVQVVDTNSGRTSADDTSSSAPSAQQILDWERQTCNPVALFQDVFS